MYDYFISYKSENANEVRLLAEALIANGARVWFAEYHVLTANYERFQEEIDRAIDSSRYALVFTNELWAQSPYCRKEIERIMERVEDGSMAGLVEICIPKHERPHRDIPALAGVPSVIWQGDFGEVIGFVADHTDVDMGEIELPAPAPDGPEGPPMLKRKHGIAFNCGRFRPSVPVLTTASQDIAGILTATVDEVTVSMGVQVNPRKTVLGGTAVPGHGFVDDRALYRAYRRYVRQWLGRSGCEEKGLHLFHVNGRSHMAVTYVAPQDSEEVSQGVRSWERRYVIDLRDENTQATGEMGVMFRAKLPSDEDEWHQMRRFCRLTRELDSMVSSLSINKAEVSSGPTGMALLTVKLVFLALLGARYGWLTSKFADPWSAIIPAFLLGFVGGELYRTLSRWPAVHSATSVLLPDRQNVGATNFEVFISSLYSWGWVHLLLLFWMALVGLTDFLAMLVVAGGGLLGLTAPWFWGAAGVLAAARAHSRVIEVFVGSDFWRPLAVRRILGWPDLAFAPSLGAASAHLPALAYAPRRRFWHADRRIWNAVSIGLLASGIAGLTGHQSAGITIAALSIAAGLLLRLVLSVIQMRHPGMADVRLSYRQAPSAETALAVAKECLEEARVRGAPGIAELALQWSARAWELHVDANDDRGSEDAAYLEQLGACAAEFAHMADNAPQRADRMKQSASWHVAIDTLSRALELKEDREADDSRIEWLLGVARRSAEHGSSS